jgi:hypothetical protein
MAKYIQRLKEVTVVLPSTAELPEDQQCRVRMLSGEVTVGEMDDIDTKASDVVIGRKVLAKRILDWNIEDEDGSEFPITEENIALFKAQDFAELVKHLGLSDYLTKDEKKTSSEQQPGKVTVQFQQSI